ncbi:MAG: RidA family protein [Nitrososphaerales archaeon]
MKSISVSGIHRPDGFANVVLSSSSSLIYVSGQGPIDENGKTVSLEFEEQVTQVFENLKKCLRAADATFNNVIKVNFFVVSMKQFPILREVRKRYLNQEKLPSMTTVGVTSLVREDWLIEIEAVAELKGS